MGSSRACDVKLPVSKTQLAMKHKLVSASLPPNEMLPKTFFKIQATTEVITFPFEPVSQPRSKLCWSLEVSCLPRDFGNMDLPTCPYSTSHNAKHTHTKSNTFESKRLRVCGFVAVRVIPFRDLCFVLFVFQA
jgi:hypothetical protein